MLVYLKNKYEDIEEEVDRRRQAVNDGQKRRERPIGGTVKAINGDMNFRTTDGYIQFLKLVIRTRRTAHPKPHKDWVACTDEIIRMAEKLTDSRVRFTGSTAAEFKEYCVLVSGCLDKEAEPLKDFSFTTIDSEFLLNLLKEVMDDGCKFGFYYEPGEYDSQLFMEELMTQLSHLKLEKSRRDHMNISYFLMDSGYHEHIHDAVNALLQIAVYAVNCSSTRYGEAYSFDIMKVENDLEVVRHIIKRIERLV